MSRAVALLAPLHPSETALAVAFQQNLSRGMLRRIAMADYGERAAEAYAALKRILTAGVAIEVPAAALEALALTRCAPATGREGQWTQLFACTALLQIGARFPQLIWDPCDLTPPFVTSCIALGEPIARAGAAVLSYRFLQHPGEPEDAACLAAGIRQLAMATHMLDQDRPWLAELAVWAERKD